MVHTTYNKHYIGNIHSKKFYYKDAIFAHYNLSVLIAVLPKEIIDIILHYICPSLVVFATKKTLHYINPNDNATIKTIILNKIRGLHSYNNSFAISENGLTFYRIYRRHMELEYLCDEVPDINKPRNKKTFNTNRYYYSYNIAKKCKISTPIYPFGPMYGNFGDKICFSSDGKYIVTCASKENVRNKSGAYIAIYEAKTKTFIKEIKFDAEEILALSLSPDNNNIIAITSRVENKNTIWLWNTFSGHNLLKKQCENNMYFEYLDNKIAWNKNSSKFAVTFITSDHISNEFPFINENDITGSCIVFGTLTDIYITNIPDKFINYITWINDKNIAFKENNEIVISSSNKEQDIILNIPQKRLMYDLTSSIDGHLIIKYSKTGYDVNQFIQQLEQYDNEEQVVDNWPQPSDNEDPVVGNDLHQPLDNEDPVVGNDLHQPLDNEDPVVEQWPQHSDNEDPVVEQWPQHSDNEVPAVEGWDLMGQINEDDDYIKWWKEQEEKENMDDYDNVDNADYIDIVSLCL